MRRLLEAESVRFGTARGRAILRRELSHERTARRGGDRPNQKGQGASQGIPNRKASNRARAEAARRPPLRAGAAAAIFLCWPLLERRSDGLTLLGAVVSILLQNFVLHQESAHKADQAAQAATQAAAAVQDIPEKTVKALVSPAPH